jgi:hypothetical protein
MNLVCKEKDLLGDRTAVWACPPEGCGRIFIEGNGDNVISGTWFIAEVNEKRESL